MRTNSRQQPSGSVGWPRASTGWLGGALALALSLVVQADVTLVGRGATWKYRADGVDLGTGWRASSYDDSSWPSGPAQFGYGDGDEATLLPSSPVRSCYYFRHAFTVIDPSAFNGLSLSLLRDDGCVVYLNGVEVARVNMPTGSIAFGSWASVAGDWGWDAPIALPSSLVAGVNVLAVEMHQANSTSTDVSLDAELIGVDGLPSVTRGPYLQMLTPDSVIVRWRTSVASDSRVRFGTVASGLDQSAEHATSTTEHAVTLTGLTPDTRYYFAVGTTTADLSAGVDHEFFTAPARGARQPYRFWVLGDPGTGTPGQMNVRNRYYNFTGTRYTDLILFLGDNAYENGTDTEYQNNVFNVYSSIFRRSASLSTIGNHDTAQSTNPNLNTTPYFQIFDLPTGTEGGGVASGTEKYYSYVYGNVRIVCLDSMTSSRASTGTMLNWLRSDLQQNTSDWLIAIWHHPPYTKGSHNSDTETALVEMRANALPILEDFGVDLVLAGHSHSYERSFLLDRHYGDSTTLVASMKADAGDGRENGTGAYRKAGTGPAAHQGAVYAVPGSAGKISGGTLNHPAMYISLNVLGSMVVDVDGHRLDATFIDDQGRVLDYFTILKGPPENNPPAVALTAPTAGASLTTPGIVSLQATATDSDGTVASVAFYDGETLVSTDSSGPPWEVAWVDPSAGNHTLKTLATDDDGAQAWSAGVNVTVTGAPSALSLAAQAVPVKCHGDSSGSINLTVAGGTAPYTFSWSNSITTEDQTGLAAGSYTVTVTDSASPPQSEVLTVAVTQPAEVLSASASAASLQLSCSDGTTTVTVSANGGTAPYSGTGSFTVGAGTHEYSVTDANGCMTTTSVTVTAPAALTATAAAGTILCAGGATTVTVSASGGTAPYLGTGSFTVGVGTHQFTVTDANGCTAIVSVGVTEPAPLVLSTAAVNPSAAGAEDGSVNLTVAGGTTPYVSSWSNGATTEDVTGLAAGTYSVTVTDANGCMASASVTLVDPLMPPVGVTAATETSTQIRLTWQDAVGETGYVVERSTSSAFTSVTSFAVAAESTGYLDTGLSRATLYYYRVKSVAGPLASGYSAAVSARTADVIAPTGLSATALSASQIALKWSDKSRNETGFRVERSTDGGASFAVVATLGANTTAWTDAGLVAETPYSYRVRAYNGTGNSDASNVASATTLGVVNTPPTAPTGLTATALTKLRISLKWTDTSTTETGFEVERSEDAGGTWSLRTTLAANATSFTDSGLTAGTTYSYRVRAVNGAGGSGYAAPVSSTAKR